MNMNVNEEIERLTAALKYYTDTYDKQKAANESLLAECSELRKEVRALIEGRNQHAAEMKEIADAAEMLWAVLANVSGGDWDKQSDDWVTAAERWRDNYLAAISGFTVSGEQEPLE